MRVVARIDGEGYFLEDVLLDDTQPLPIRTIEARPPEGFYRPRWTGEPPVWEEGKPAAEILTDAKAQKEAELRDAADQWYQADVRSFEGAIVTAKYGRGGLTALSTEERAVFDEMNANYTKLKNLVASVRAASTVEEVEAVTWS